MDGSRLAFASEVTTLAGYGSAPLVLWPEVLAIETPVGVDTPFQGIANRRGELLFDLRDDLPGQIAWPNHWSVLGGGCDPGEDPAYAIVRELDEEAGLTDISDFA
ncbi:NUDIX domain-containing protein [Streptomyces sp. NPDC087843]|uniref:NUDIX domain-containing protein n=1 Tax=Streptomyces sp. NPDC087843 TaxID=3365804 RepID=UPI0038048E9F